jgi:hypothetical protein
MTQNPYKEGTASWKAWQRGYMASHDDNVRASLAVIRVKNLREMREKEKG